MDFWRTILVLVRRWYVTLPAFWATLGLAAAAYATTPVQYESAAVAVLTSPLTGGTESTQPTGPVAVTNPLLNFAQGLALAGSILIQDLSSPETVDALGVTPGGTTSYRVDNGTSNPELLQSGPFVFITGSGTSAEDAQDVTRRVLTMAGSLMAERQRELGAPDSTHITVQTVVAPTYGRPLRGSALRAAAAAGALAGLISLVTVYGVESIATRRRRRRGTTPGPADATVLRPLEPAEVR